jgi:flavin reductase (DIM6/NTAB) family NADH-FMN oxidoreductase RutF
MFSSSGRKDSLEIAEATGEFVCNFVGEALIKAMNQTSFAYERGISEFGGGAGPRRSAGSSRRRASPPRRPRWNAASPISGGEGTGRKPVGNWMVFGEVVGVHIDDAMLTDGLFDLAKAKPVTRLGYLDYGLRRTIVERWPSQHG